MPHTASRRLRAIILLLLLAAPSARAGGVLGEDFNEDENREYSNQLKLRLSVETGYSHWMYDPNLSTQSYQNYADGLEEGWDYSAQLAYFPWSKGGIGAEWIWFLSRNKGDNIRRDTGSAAPAHSMRERVSFVYYGPTFLSRIQFDRYGLLIGGVGAGLLLVHDGFTDNGHYNLVEATTYAVVGQVGWDYPIFRSLGVGVNGRILLADIKEYTYNGHKVTIKQPDDPHYWINIFLNRLELNFGLRFGL
jgi:hypothetical protein